MGSFLTSLFSGVWGYVAVGIVATGLSASGTYFVTSKTYGLEISNLKLAQSQVQTADLTASLNKLNSFIGEMHTADVNYQSNLDNINKTFASLKGAMHVTLNTPLPPDCKPDPGRVSDLTAAIAATNTASGARSNIGATVPANP